MMSFGRRVRPASIIPRSAACWARKRKSIDCAFSELRAWDGGMGLVGGGEEGGEWGLYHDYGFDEGSLEGYVAI